MSEGLRHLLEAKRGLEEARLGRPGAEGALPSLSRKKFEERTRRVTLYLTNETYSDLQAVRSQGYNQSALVDRAVTEFLAKNWSTTGHE